MARKPLPYEAIIIDDKGLIFCTPEGEPVPGGKRVIFHRDTVYSTDGNDYTIWVSVNTTSLEVQFDSIADMRAYCREEGVKLEVLA